MEEEEEEEPLFLYLLYPLRLVPNLLLSSASKSGVG